MLSEQFFSYYQKTAGGGAQGNISPNDICKFRVPLPAIITQRAIVVQIEEAQRFVNANKELITIFEKKIKATINRVWDDEDTSSLDQKLSDD